MDCVPLRLKTDGLRYGSWGKYMKTLADFQPLKPAEQKLLECCLGIERNEEQLTSASKNKNIIEIFKGRPTEKTEHNEMRADFLRWLILTSEVIIDPKGIEVQRAWVSGKLDLEHVHCLHVLSFFHSVFEEVLLLRGATTKSIHMNGSLCKKGIDADGLICHGNLNLRKGFESEDEVRFLIARIEGEIDCSNAKFKALNGKENVLSCDGINVEGAVTLANSYFEGTVRFVGAEIRSNFDCTQATFQALKEEKKALCCDSMTAGGLILRENCKILRGILDLSNVTVGGFGDDADFWKSIGVQKVKLDGFKYGHIYGDTSASFRLENMLGKMLEFAPQPYKQLAKVLRTMGHKNDADEVMIALHEKKMEISKSESLSYLLQKIYKWTSLYGYRPLRLIYIILIFWGAFGFIYWYAASVAVFAPSNPLIFQKDYNCTIDQKGTPWNALPKDYNASNNWYYATPPEYSTFQPFWYSLDLLLPTLDLQLEKDWGVVIPSPKGNWTDGSAFLTTNDDNEIVFIINYLIRFFVWIEILIGWLLGIGLVAFVSGQLRIVED